MSLKIRPVLTADREPPATPSTSHLSEIATNGASHRHTDCTVCAMWLAVRATRFGFTNDGRFFRPYMRAVETRLRQVSPDLEVVKE